MRRLALACTVVLAACSSPQEGAPPAVTPSASSKPAPPLPSGPVDAKTFTEHLKKLSADEFEGRKPGTLGERLSTAYIKDQFERLGLKPGNKGSWFQSVPITEIELVDADAVKLDVASGDAHSAFAFKTDMPPKGKLGGSTRMS